MVEVYVCVRFGNEWEGERERDVDGYVDVDGDVSRLEGWCKGKRGCCLVVSWGKCNPPPGM